MPAAKHASPADSTAAVDAFMARLDHPRKPRHILDHQFASQPLDQPELRQSCELTRDSLALPPLVVSPLTLAFTTRYP